jgi:uncharacterized cupredoxin-like copper-binding protein
MAIGPAWASAAPAPFVDDTATDFAAGAPGTATSTTDAPGSVRLKKTLKSEPFNGPALPASMEALQWTQGAGSAAVDVPTGTLKVDGERVNDTRFYDPGQTLEFTATFSAAASEHIGFGNTLEGAPWAIFTTAAGNGANLEASTLAPGQMPSEAMRTDIPGVSPTAPHTFRIVWTATSVDYYILDVQSAPVASHPVAIAAQMRPVMSDFTAGDALVLSVDSLGLNLYPTSGAFESRVENAGDPRAIWGALNATVAGTGATFETRSGNTATPDTSWSNYQALGAGGHIQSPSAQYIQYRATLNTGDDRVTPSLDRVEMSYDIDTVAPSVAADAVQVNGTTARVAFASPDSDVAGFQCSLDGGAFTACTSPKDYSGLSAGSHTVSLRGVDRVGNVGTPISKTFSVASSQGGGQTGGGSSGVDKTAPKVTLVAKSLKASKKGTVSFTVACPATEATCKVTLKLKNGAKTVASKTVTVKGGKTKTVTLQLNKATRQQLKHRSLKLSSVLSASDAAGNKRTTSKKVTLHKS